MKNKKFQTRVYLELYRAKGPDDGVQDTSEETVAMATIWIIDEKIQEMENGSIAPLNGLAGLRTLVTRFKKDFPQKKIEIEKYEKKLKDFTDAVR